MTGTIHPLMGILPREMPGVRRTGGCRGAPPGRHETNTVDDRLTPGTTGESASHSRKSAHHHLDECKVRRGSEQARLTPTARFTFPHRLACK